MKASIKRKLSIGVGLQFLLIAVSVVVGMVYVNVLSSDTSNILSDNFKTLEYCNAIAVAIDDQSHPESAVTYFRENLEKQRKNVTEAGEQELTNALGQYFKEFEARPSDSLARLRIRNNLNAIVKLNMDAIAHKSQVALDTAKSANVVMGTVGTVSFVFAFILLLNLPNIIADPIKEFVASTKEIAKKNYAWRTDELRNDEFGELAKSFNSMASKLEAYESSNVAQMLFEKRRMETLINQMHNPVIGLNQLKTILFANTAALKVLNMQSEDLIGKPAEEVAGGNDLLRTLIMPQGEATASNKQNLLKIYADDKESFFEKEVVQVTVNSKDNAKEKYIGDVIILQNITPYKELDTAKTNFIATVSHEFKTPISAIKMSLQLLQNAKIGPLNAEQTTLVDSIKDDADRLLRITSELLDFTQVESGQIHLNIRPVQLQEIVEYALSATRAQAEQKPVRMDVALPAQLPPVMADSEKTAWVITNLISNAIRYSYEHSAVSVIARVVGERVRIEVKDTGQGIAPQYQTKVFERYFRVPGTMQEGSGLGLAISKEFIETQGGRIGMESEFGAGSLFWIELVKG
jgi:two-component system, NtrC family, sensor histidine kinase KinB